MQQLSALPTNAVPVLSAMDAFVQSLEIFLQVLLVLVHRHLVDSWAEFQLHVEF